MGAEPVLDTGHGGRVVKGPGDGFLATFGSAAQAANAAVGFQRWWGGDSRACPPRFAELAPDLAAELGPHRGQWASSSVEVADCLVTPDGRVARQATGFGPWPTDPRPVGFSAPSWPVGAS